MAAEIKIPNLGENVESGDVLEIMVSVGDTIEKDQGLVELETDKATVVVPATAAGVVQEIHCQEGDTVSVGQVIVTVESAGDPAPSDEAGDDKKSEKPAEPSSTSDEEEQAEASTPSQPAPKQTDSPKPVPDSSIAAKSSSNSSSTPQTAQTRPAPSDTSTATAELDSKGKLIPAGPAIRRFAREVGVDLSGVEGTGEGGRITREDILKIVRQGIPAPSGSVATTSGQSDGHGPVHIEKMPKIRQTIAHKMHESWTTCPRVTNFDDADVTALEDVRQNSKNDYSKIGIKLTTMPFLIKAVAMSLKMHPIINASVDMEAGQIIYKDYINVGIAVDTERGLVVPVLRNADKLSIPEIAKQLGDLAEGVRENNFSLEQLKGGTFTISNLGAIGGTYSTPIINTPETAILLAGRSRKLPVVTAGDKIEVRLMMPLSLSYDHRLIDGGAAARFLNDVIAYLEAPSRLLMAL